MHEGRVPVGGVHTCDWPCLLRFALVRSLHASFFLLALVALTNNVPQTSTISCGPTGSRIPVGAAARPKVDGEVFPPVVRRSFPDSLPFFGARGLGECGAAGGHDRTPAAGARWTLRCVGRAA
jgi:hypothetical protein